jgi:hypothetical protein
MRTYEPYYRTGGPGFRSRTKKDCEVLFQHSGIARIKLSGYRCASYGMGTGSGEGCIGRCTEDTEYKRCGECGKEK